MANATNLPGIIGQVYEDRRNGDSGKLISRDEKCKTLTFQSDDGNSFVKSYSHFRSYMRKKADVPEEEIKEEAYAEAELTSVEVSEADAEKMEKNAKRKAKAAEKAKADVLSKEQKAQMSVESKASAYKKLCDVLDAYVESFKSNRVELSRRDYKNYCAIKICGRALITLYSRHKKDEVYVACATQMVTEPKHSMELRKCRHHSAKTTGTYTESHSIFFSELNDYLEELRPVIVEIVSFVKEKESEA